MPYTIKLPTYYTKRYHQIGRERRSVRKIEKGRETEREGS